MRCPERDGLFEAYYGSVSAFSDTVSRMRESEWDSTKAYDEARSAQQTCVEALRALEIHEREHG